MWGLIQFIIGVICVYLTIEWWRNDFVNITKILKRSRLATYISNSINNLYNRKIIKEKKNITEIKVIIGSVLLFFVVAMFLYLNIKVLSTSIILSLPCLFAPIILSKILIQNTKQKISKQLPFYAINIKNQMKDENNIIQAIKRTKVDAPLDKYIDEFLISVFNGTSVISAFEKLKQNVDVKDFTELINSFEVCYKNGGNFVQILEKYIMMKTKEKLNKEEAEEKTFSAVVTLIIMTILNVFVVFSYVFANESYATIIRNTFIGKMILNLNAISYLLTALIISRVYKED